MSAMDDYSDDEMRHNALNDPGLFLDLDDDDDDVVLTNALALPTITNETAAAAQQADPSQPPPQLQLQQSSTTSRLSGVGIPKLDVTALSDVSPGSAARLPDFGTPGMTNSPLGYSREGAAEHFGVPFNPSSQNSSPHNVTTSPNLAGYNVYSNIANPPLCAKKLNFRDFLNQKAVSPHIENEESTGIFVGQLPSSYSEDDIEALLKAIGNEHGQTVQVRDVKSHNRDRTCAFIMINASALSAVLDFTKRVLCDINCVWVVEHNQAPQLPLFVQQMPRDQLRGVPKAALVLEKLTPQSKPRHSMHGNQGAMATSPNAGYAAMQANLISPMGVMSHPMYLQQQQQQQQQQPPQLQQQQGNNGAMPAAVPFMDVAAFQPTSPFNNTGYVPPSLNTNALPQFFNANAFQSPGTSGILFNNNNNSSSGVAPSPTSAYAMQMGGNAGIANLEAANQMMIAASRSRTNSQSHALNIAPLSPPNGAMEAPAPVPTAVQLTPVLQQAHCSCGSNLYLSQYPEAGTCTKCKNVVSARDVAYWCPHGHLCVCIMCALRTPSTKDGASGVSKRFTQPQGELMLH